MKGFLAAVMTLTRIPLWKVLILDKKYFRKTLLYWPLVGYITGGVTLGVLWGASSVMPLLPACVLAILSRLLLTGAMHEDGLADFFDGFGGGTTKEKILAIMKDSHIGCYGTIGLIVYLLLYLSLLYSFDIRTALPLILIADVFSKLCASITINSLSYVRKEEESKTQLVYLSNSVPEILLIGCLACLPFLILPAPVFLGAIPPTLLAAYVLRQYLKKKIGGYTGDCCGASVLIIEQVFYLSCVILYCI